MRRLFFMLICFVLPLLCSGAGWDASAWPAYQYERKGRTLALNCYSGLCERASAAGASLPAAPSFWKFNKQNLQNLKNKCESLVPYFVCTNEAVGGTFDNYFSSKNTTALPMLSLTSVCAIVGIPTNFFDYTPWRCLNGLGPFTNDASEYSAIGHAYGWTNNETSRGGTHTLPSGRSYWTTTDYGFQGLHDVINLMLFTSHSLSWLNPHADGTNGYSAIQHNPFTNDWEYAKSSAESAFGPSIHNDVNGNKPPAHYTYGKFPGVIPVDHDAAIVSRESYLRTDSPLLPTDYNCQVDFYIQCEKPLSVPNLYNQGISHSVPDSDAIWDDHGFGISEDMVYITSTGLVNSIYVYSPIIGDMTTNPAVWCDKPITNEVLNMKSRGWKCIDENCVIKWDVSGGFEYID